MHTHVAKAMRTMCRHTSGINRASGEAPCNTSFLLDISLNTHPDVNVPRNCLSTYGRPALADVGPMTFNALPDDL